jgi:hypothetical protein
VGTFRRSADGRGIGEVAIGNGADYWTARRAEIRAFREWERKRWRRRALRSYWAGIVWNVGFMMFDLQTGHTVPILLALAVHIPLLIIAANGVIRNTDE